MTTQQNNIGDQLWLAEDMPMAPIEPLCSKIAVYRDHDAAIGDLPGDTVVPELARRGYALVYPDNGTVGDDGVDLHVVLWNHRCLDRLQQNPPVVAPVIYVGSSAPALSCDVAVVVEHPSTPPEVEKIVDEILCWRRLSWDSEFFAKSIGTVTRQRMTRRVGAFVTKDCSRAGLDCLYYLADCQDAESVTAAEAHGFHLVDMRLTFERNLRDAGVLFREASADIRPCTEADIPDLRDIARNSYLMSRYYFDRRFSREQCQRFYTEWIEKSCRGYASAVLVATDQGGPVGYITCQIRDGATGAIELVGVSERARGRSIGQRLVLAALGWFQGQGLGKVIVVTQGRNFGAQRLYQKCGFFTADAQLWYHKWFMEEDR